MEERKLNEKESLELIAQMIQNTRRNLDAGSGNMFLLWGYLGVVVTLLVLAAVYLDGGIGSAFIIGIALPMPLQILCGKFQKRCVGNEILTAGAFRNKSFRHSHAGPISGAEKQNFPIP